MIRGLIGIVTVFLTVIFPLYSAIRDPSRPRHDKIVACYVASWSQYRLGKGEFQFENFTPTYCTHVIYSFAGLNVSSSTIRSLDPWADFESGRGTYKKVTDLRRKYPWIKVSLAIGGWNEGSANYSALANSPQRRSIFVSSVIDYLKEYKFDGLDLDWEFPGKRGGAIYDKKNFMSLIQELSQALKSRGLLLTAAISADKSTIDIAYDVPGISKYLDFINVMAYDYHGAWDERVLSNAPLHCQDELCVEGSINYLLKIGAPADKLVVGLPMYGRTFILKMKLENSQSPMGVPCLKTGFQGNFTLEDGFMGYNEICNELVLNPSSWRTGWDESSNSAYAVHGDKVVVYDNAKSIEKKIEYVKQMNLAGVMVWSIDTDDFRGECGKLHQDLLDPLTGLDYPLMRIINIVLGKTLPSDEDNSLNSKPSSASLNNLSNLLIISLTIFLPFYKSYL